MICLRSCTSCRLLGKEGDASSEQKPDGNTSVKAGQVGQGEGAAQGQAAFGQNDLVTDKNFANEGLAYARDVEVTNGRYAMLG